MSTCAGIGRYEDNQTKTMKYVTHDGYPSSIGTELINILKRDGGENTLTNIVDCEETWDFIEAAPIVPETYTRDTDKYEVVEGYGRKIRETTYSSSMLNFENSDILWGYFIDNETNIHVFHASCCCEVACINANDEQAKSKMLEIDLKYRCK